MTRSPEQANPQQTISAERADILETLTQARYFLRYTVQGLTDEQAASRPTVSALSLGGLIKHVSLTEHQWAEFIVEGTSAMEFGADTDYTQWEDAFRMLPGETLSGLLDAYEEVAARTDELVRTHPDLDLSHALPPAPWFTPGARRSVRRTFVHIAAETAQHAGHADILRESIDGRKSMG